MSCECDGETECAIHATRWSEYDHLPDQGIYRTRECYRDGDAIHTTQKAYVCQCLTCQPKTQAKNLGKP